MSGGSAAMAHLLDLEVGGRVILQPAPLGGQKRQSYSFLNLQALNQEDNLGPLPQKVTATKSLRGVAGSGASSRSDSNLDPRVGRPRTVWNSGGDLASHGTPVGASAGAKEYDKAGREIDLIHFDDRLDTFHLRCGNAQYAFCVDKHGCLEKLHFGPWVGTGTDFTYLSETDPALTFEAAPAGVSYSTGELMRLVGDQKADSRQLWALSTHMYKMNKVKDERGRSFCMSRVENMTWRLRHKWNQMLRNPDEPAWDPDAESILNLLKSSTIDSLLLGPEKFAPPVDPERQPQQGREESRTKPKHLIKDDDAPRQGEKCSKQYEFSEFGVGDFRAASLEVCFRRDGSRLLPLAYRSHRIISGIVPSISGLPVLGSRNPAGARTLIVDMVDPYTELKVQLLFTVFQGVPAVCRRTIIRNTTRVGMGDVEILKCVSATLDFLTSDWHLVSLHGGWANERQVKVRRLQEGIHELSSRRGVSSHQCNPFCVMTNGPPQEDHGQAYGISLLYSGNWLVEVDQADTGCVRVNAGLNPLSFSWNLGYNESFETPECVCVFSDQGLGKMSQVFHQLYSERLVNPRWHDLRCPVLINTWEALYFQVYHERVMELARPAKEAGVELLVLDDGWFGQRDDDCSSLGDWKPDIRKLPRGLDGLAQDLNELGLKLGLWFEPEMVNQTSELYRKHPEWVLHHPKRLRAEGRNQLVLDLTRVEVQDYIIDSVSSILSSANIEYVKWDMNRALTDAFSVALPAKQQGEVFHRYVLGLYRIFETVTERYPHVLFESCSSGGGRFDPALFKWCPQCWCSDNTDAFSRVRIQTGTSLWAHPRFMGAHITACPNHQTHRTVMMKTRFIVALYGTFGLELDMTKMSKAELAEIRELVELRQSLCSVTLHGILYRLPFFGYPGLAPGDSAGVGESNVYAWMFVTPDATRAVVSALVFFRDTVGKFPSRLKLKGLKPELVYELREHVPTPVEEGIFNGIFQPGGLQPKHVRSLKLSGAVLMSVGLPIHFNFDGDAVLLELNAIEEVNTQMPLSRQVSF